MMWMKLSTAKSCELCNHRFTFTTEHKLKPYKRWETGTGTAKECGELLCKICVFGAMTMLATIVLFGFVKWRKTEAELRRWFWDDSVHVTISVLFLVLIGMVMLMIVSSMYFSAVALLKKWREHNSVLVVQDV